MRRTGIKRGTKPLERRTELHRGESQLARTPLRTTSKKRDRENRERKAMANELWPDGRPACAKPDCWRPADDLHEPLTRARRGSITDPNNSVPLCRGHHDEVGDEVEWAYEMALLIHSWEKTPLDVLASVRKQILAGEVPVEGIEYCHRWLPEHGCDQPAEEDAA